jgi:hypothetical protein
MRRLILAYGRREVQCNDPKVRGIRTTVADTTGKVERWKKAVTTSKMSETLGARLRRT